MSSRGKSWRRLHLLELLSSLKKEYINLTAEEDNSDEVVVWEECVRILHLALEASSLQPYIPIMVKKCVIQIVRVLPVNILTEISAKPDTLATLLLRDIQQHEEKDLIAFLEWIVTWKTFPKLYFAAVSQEGQHLIYNGLFAVLFRLIRTDDVEMPKVLAALSNMIRVCESITFIALSIILYNLMQHRFHRTQALATLLLKEFQEELSIPIDEIIYNQLMSEDVPEEVTKFARFGFEVINRLYRIHPCLRLCRAMTNVLTEERRNTQSAVECLIKLFTEDGSAVALRLPKLWNSFLKCVKKPEYREMFLEYCPRFFLKFERYNYICRPLVDMLEQFSKDQVTDVRLLTVRAITNAVLLMPYLLERNTKLFEIFTTLSSDGKEGVRKEAIYSLGKIYAMFVKVNDLQDQAQIIVNFIVHEYGSTLYFNPKRQLISAVIRKYIIRDVLDTEARMNQLVVLWAFLDDESKRCFHNYLDIKKKKSYQDCIENNTCFRVRVLMLNLKRLLSADDTATVRDQRKIVLQHINFFTSGQLHTLETRKEKCQELQVLLRYMAELDESSTKDVNIREDVMTLIYELVCEYPERIDSSETWNKLVSLSHKNTDEQNVTLLKLFASLPVEIDNQCMTEESDSFWKSFLRGSTQQLKFGLKCICKHEEKFSEDIQYLLRDIHDTSEQDEEAYLRGIVSLGYLAQYLQTNMYLECITNMCDKVIERQIFHTTQTDASPNLRTWSKRSELPHNLRCKVEALKAITRIVCRRRNKALTSKTVDLLGTLVDRGGDYTQEDHLGSMDKNWLRLTAGLSYLKMCNDIVLFKSQIRIDCFFKMARLMNDPIRQVRTRFVTKLGQKLMQFNKLNFGLVNHFLAYFCLCELEAVSVAREEWKQLLQNCIKEKRLTVWYYTTIYSNPTRAQVVEEYHLILPEFSIQIAVTLLAHYINITTAKVAKRKITDCLTFLMTTLMDPKVSHSFPRLSPGYYMNIFNHIKMARDALNPNDEEMNKKLLIVCQIGSKIVNMMHRKPRDTIMPKHVELDKMFFIVNA